MRVTNGDIWQALPALGELCQEPWPVRTAYRLARLSRRLAEHRRDIDRVRVDLINRHGAINERGQAEVKPDSDGFPAFRDAFEELMAEEVELDAEPVALPATEGLRVKPSVLLALGPFVAIEEEPGV